MPHYNYNNIQIHALYISCVKIRGFTMAVLNTGGTTPEARDELIKCVAAGRSSSKHSTNRDVGIGSSEQVLGADLSITF